MIPHILRSSVAPPRRSIALPIGSLALLMLMLIVADPAMANPGRAPGVFISAHVGTQRLDQYDHAPPLCCGERDSWQAWGPSARAAVGWLFPSGFSVAGDVGFAAISPTGDEGEYDLRLYGYALGVDWNPNIGPLLGSVGVGIAGASYSGDFDSLGDESGTLIGGQVRGGLQYPLSATFAVGADARVTAYAITNTAIDLSLGVTWSGL